VALADEFFRLAHDDVTGRLRLAGRPASLGLAAALLGELVFGGNLWVKDRYVSIRACDAPADVLGRGVLDRLAAEPGLTDVRTWVSMLADGALEDVARRLWRAGHLRPRRKRRRLRPETVWVPTSMNAAAMPRALLSVRLRRGEPLAQTDVFLAGLCVVTGLDGLLFDGAPLESRRYLGWLVDELWPPARELVETASSAVADVILAAR